MVVVCAFVSCFQIFAFRKAKRKRSTAIVVRVEEGGPGANEDSSGDECGRHTQPWRPMKWYLAQKRRLEEDLLPNMCGATLRAMWFCAAVHSRPTFWLTRLHDSPHTQGLSCCGN